MNATANGLRLDYDSQNLHSYDLESFTAAIRDGGDGWSGSLYDGGVYINDTSGVISFAPESTEGLTQIEWNATANTATGLLTGGNGALVA